MFKICSSNFVPFYCIFLSARVSSIWPSKCALYCDIYNSHTLTGSSGRELVYYDTERGHVTRGQQWEISAPHQSASRKTSRDAVRGMYTHTYRHTEISTALPLLLFWEMQTGQRKLKLLTKTSWPIFPLGSPPSSSQEDQKELSRERPIMEFLGKHMRVCVRVRLMTMTKQKSLSHGSID